MFGLFKKSTPTINFDQAHHDLYGGKKPAKPKPLVEDTDVLVARFRAQAEVHIQERMKLAESQVTDPLLTAGARAKAVEQRYDELCEEEAAINTYVAQAEREDHRHEELLASLDALKDEVRRGATAANMMDFAKRHPFLTGLIGTHLYQKLTSK